MILQRILFLLVGVAFSLLLGCNGEETNRTPSPPITNKVQPTKKAKTVDVTPEEAKEEAAFVYDPSGKRDPFEALMSVKKPIVQDQVPLTPLQEYDLGQFRLIGAIVGKGNPKAMVEAPGGKPFLLEKGVKIGKNNGIVVEINDSEVVVEERYYDFSGAVRTSLSKIQFPPREGVN